MFSISLSLFGYLKYANLLAALGVTYNASCRHVTNLEYMNFDQQLLSSGASFRVSLHVLCYLDLLSLAVSQHFDWLAPEWKCVVFTESYDRSITWSFLISFPPTSWNYSTAKLTAVFLTLLLSTLYAIQNCCSSNASQINKAWHTDIGPFPRNFLWIVYIGKFTSRSRCSQYERGFAIPFICYSVLV